MNASKNRIIRRQMKVLSENKKTFDGGIIVIWTKMAENLGYERNSRGHRMNVILHFSSNA